MGDNWNYIRDLVSQIVLNEKGNWSFDRGCIGVCSRRESIGLEFKVNGITPGAIRNSWTLYEIFRWASWGWTGVNDSEILIVT